MKHPKGKPNTMLVTVYGNIKGAAQRKPVLAMIMVISCCTMALPFVSALALFPLVGLISFSQYLESKGKKF